MQEISGKEIAERIIERLKSQSKPQKTLAAILVGDNPSSISFLRQKQKIAEELGVNFEIHKFDESISESDLVKKVKEMGESENIGGVIIQLPLPKNFNRENILNAIPKEKDVDALNGAPVLPPAVEVAREILETINYKLETGKIAVVGLGFLVGRPISEWLKGNPSTGLRARCAELYLLDIGDSLDVLKNADLVITGVGKAGLIKPEMLRNGAVIIDFGYDSVNGKISGDFDINNLKANEAEGLTYTPTPGGTGPILVAKLFENFYKLNS